MSKEGSPIWECLGADSLNIRRKELIWALLGQTSTHLALHCGGTASPVTIWDLEDGPYFMGLGMRDGIQDMGQVESQKLLFIYFRRTHVRPGGIWKGNLMGQVTGKETLEMSLLFPEPSFPHL